VWKPAWGARFESVDPWCLAHVDFVPVEVEPPVARDQERLKPLAGDQASAPAVVMATMPYNEQVIPWCSRWGGRVITQMVSGRSFTFGYTPTPDRRPNR